MKTKRTNKDIVVNDACKESVTLKNKHYKDLEERDDIIIEQWCKAVDMADTSIDKRHNSSNVYMSIEVAMVPVISFVNNWWNYVVAVVGILIAIVWFLSVRSYKALSSVKYDVINQIEEMLPIQPFKYEWEILKKEKAYKQVTKLERFIPIVFAVLYVIIIVGLALSSKTDVITGT